MNIVVAPDSFKESLSAKLVAENITMAIKKVMPDANVLQIPISDGGEGLLEALLKPLDGELIAVKVKDPLLRNIDAQYGILGDGITAVIEMAKASGLELLEKNEQNPMLTSSYGTGELIKDALNKGCKKIIIGLGGSATNDGGAGMIKALGAKFLDKNGRTIKEGGGFLDTLYKIDLSEFDNRIFECDIIGACDVSNPLVGDKGASFVFGGQKGGSHPQLKALDQNLMHYATTIKTSVGVDVENVEGAGAAGGTGAALLAFFNAKLESGITLVLKQLQLEKHIKEADIVITGEGKIDQQTLYGKTISGVAKLAQKHNVPVIAIAGKIGKDIDKLYDMGISAIFSIVNEPMPLTEAIEKTEELIQSCVVSIFRLIKTAKN